MDLPTHIHATTHFEILELLSRSSGVKVVTMVQCSRWPVEGEAPDVSLRIQNARIVVIRSPRVARQLNFHVKTPRAPDFKVPCSYTFCALTVRLFKMCSCMEVTATAPTFANHPKRV